MNNETRKDEGMNGENEQGGQQQAGDEFFPGKIIEAPNGGDIRKTRKKRSSSRIVAVLRSELDKIVIKSGATPKAVREALAKDEEPGDWVILCIRDEFTLAAQTKMVLARTKK